MSSTMIQGYIAIVLSSLCVWYTAAVTLLPYGPGAGDTEWTSGLSDDSELFVPFQQQTFPFDQSERSNITVSMFSSPNCACEILFVQFSLFDWLVYVTVRSAMSCQDGFSILKRLLFTITHNYQSKLYEFIMKTCPCSAYLFILFLLQNIDCGGYYVYPQSMF